MALTGITIQKPNFTPPPGWSGLITDILSYSVHRQINQAGSFTVQMRTTAQQASLLRAGWRVSIKEERLAQNPDVTMPEWIMRHGRVLSRAYHIDQAGAGILEIQGETWLGDFINYLITKDLVFTHSNLATMVAGLNTATGLTTPVNTPLRCTLQFQTVTITDQTALAALLKLAELSRTNLREEWDTNAWTFTDQDDLPPVTGMTELGVGDLFLRQVEQGDPSLAPNQGFGPGRWGLGIIQGLPTVSYDGKDIVNRIVAIGTDWDGAELTLQSAVFPSGLYPVHVALGADGNPFWYIQDDTSIDDHGPVSLHLVRSDVKNPSNDPTTKAAAKKALLAVASNELLRRRSETLSVGVQILNGAELAVLPGERVYIRYEGNAVLPDGRTTWLHLDQYMLVQGRTDTGGIAGVRQVALDLVAPVRSYNIPGLPVAIPTPLPRATQPPIYPHDPIPFDPGPRMPQESYPIPADLMGSPNATLPTDTSQLSPLVDSLVGLKTNNGAYQPCCADQTTSINDIGDVGPIAPPSGSPMLSVGEWSRGVESFAVIDGGSGDEAWDHAVAPSVIASPHMSVNWNALDFLVPIVTSGVVKVTVWAKDGPATLDLSFDVNQSTVGEPTLSALVDVAHSITTGFYYVSGVIDSGGDGSTHAIKQYDADGTILNFVQYGTTGADVNPIALAKDGTIYAVYEHDGNADILVYDETLTLVTTWASVGITVDIDVDEDGFIYGFDKYNLDSETVVKFDGTGTQIATFPLAASDFVSLTVGGRDASVGGDGSIIHLYVLLTTPGTIRDYNAGSGALINTFNEPGAGGTVGGIARLKIVPD